MAEDVAKGIAENRWMFVIRALNHPGTLTAAAAVFSNRGVSLEGFLGSGVDTTTVADGRLLFSFRATQAKQDLLKRSLERLPSIFQVDAYPYNDERLRAIAIAKLTLDAQVEATERLHVEIILYTEDSRLLLLSGETGVVESAIARLRQQQQLKDVVMSAITV
ncbi:MAG: hypothetical protein WA984_11400 [Phormidesmis sp.]